MDYETLRQFADTWGLVFLVVSFVGAVGFAFRKSARADYERQAQIPLREDQTP